MPSAKQVARKDGCTSVFGYLGNLVWVFEIRHNGCQTPMGFGSFNLAAAAIWQQLRITECVTPKWRAEKIPRRANEQFLVRALSALGERQRIWKMENPGLPREKTRGRAGSRRGINCGNCPPLVDLTDYSRFGVFKVFQNHEIPSETDSLTPILNEINHLLFP